MKILILNQAFYPDVVSTAQHATDLALALTDAGHEVTVICGRRAYDLQNLAEPPLRVRHLDQRSESLNLCNRNPR
jgi:hypothetical protein